MLRPERVWKRTDLSNNDTYFYHTGGKLIQELDDQYEVNVDYLAGKRRYMPNEAEADKYRYYTRDQQGSVVMMTDHEQNEEEYKYDAWGEHVDTTTLPSTENNIRYAGLRVECFIDSQNSLNAIYEVGVRHYWPAIGRFLQRDPLTYNKMPKPSYPLGVNPYIYCENNPVMLVDSSGLKGQYIRGATMDDASMWLGTIKPGKLYDCCEEGFNTVPDDKVWDAKLFWHTTIGFFTYRQAASLFGWTSFCDLDPSEAQPGHGCAEVTTMDPELACTFLEQCKGGSCGAPAPPHKPKKPKKKKKKDLPEMKDPGCPEGVSGYDYGFEGELIEGNLSAGDELELILGIFYNFVEGQSESLRDLYRQDPVEFPKIQALEAYLISIWGPFNALERAVYYYQHGRSEPSWNYACGDWTEDIVEELESYHFQHYTFEYYPAFGGLHAWVRVTPVDPDGPGIILDPWFFGKFGALLDPFWWGY